MDKKEAENKSETKRLIELEKNLSIFYELLAHERQTEIRAFELSPDYKKSVCKQQLFVGNKNKFLEEVLRFNGRYNLYAGLNERRLNGTNENDIISIKWFFLDIDCKDKPANEEDLLLCKRVTDKIKKELLEKYEAKPTEICSGNGFQLLYRLPEIKITNENREQMHSKIENFTRYLIQKYSNEKIKLDNVADLPRIIRITGTINIKGNKASYFNEISKEPNPKLYEEIMNFNISEKNCPEEKQVKDNSRSGLEFRKILALLREKKSREQIYKEMQAYSKWKDSNEEYKSITFEKAENIYLQEQIPVKAVEQEPTQEILSILQDKYLFEKITKDEFDKKIVGEAQTRKVIFLCSAGGRLIENCQLASYNLLVNDEAGTGKDYVTSKVLEILPKEVYIHKTRISPAVFTYWHSADKEPLWTWDGKVFYPEDISETVLNSDVFKVMCSSGSSATIVIKQRAVDIEIVGKPVLITTTATSTPSPELTRRFVILNLDSSEEQTKAIMKRHCEFAKQGIILEYNEKYKEAMKYLKRVKVLIPFADLIAEILPSKNVIMRTHLPRFLDYIKASAGFYQYQRKIDKNFILATGKDYDLARECFLKLCSNKYMIPLTINQKRILETFEREPEAVNVAKFHANNNFMTLKSMEYNFSILCKYGLLETSTGQDYYNRPIELYNLSKSYRSNEKITIPTFEELCRISKPCI
jgi:hypothetical protein